MPADLNILRTAGALSRYAAMRHQVIAANVANADTPGYRAKDLPSFADLVRREGAAARPRTLETLGAASPNGNSVSLEDQMMRAGEAIRASEIAAMVFTKTIEMLRAAGARPR